MSTSQSANPTTPPHQIHTEGQTRVAGDPAGVHTDRQYDPNSTLNPPTGASAYSQERPLDTKPTSEGGVAIGGRADLPEGHATMTDKAIGKTEKVAGKVTRNPERHERGELREAGGKDAAYGDARAPRD